MALPANSCKWRAANVICAAFAFPGEMFMRILRSAKSAAVFSRLMVAAALTPLPAAGQADFYKGKTVELIISTGAGGGLDTNGRIVARHLAKHIPGEPTIVPKNMPGAGHI